MKKRKSEAVRYVSLDDWLAFEKFQEYLDQLDEGFADLQESWQNHLDYLTSELRRYEPEFEDVGDNISRLGDLLNMFRKCETRQPPRYLGILPQAKIAKIIIEEVSDGKI